MAMRCSFDYLITQILTPEITVSTGQTEKNPANRVIIRGFRDRPAALVAVEVRGAAVDVVGSDQESPMPFHLDRAFAFDQVLYDQLAEAYATRNAKALAALWRKATPFVPDSKG
ncbi:MAG: hypothetical protein HYS13_20105 [Planctomycetia bacterium]|nr:hypothetical protein [Planctomycetia bacterium]